MSSYTPDHYRQWYWLWTPFFPTMTGLFLVRYPGDLLQMTKPLYQDLMQLRFQCLIQDWLIETEFTQQETHQLLCRALYALEPTQPPQLGDLRQWQQEWAMIICNEAFFQKLSQRMERHFPFRMHPPIPSEQQQLRAREQEMLLHEWLIELTGQQA